MIFLLHGDLGIIQENDIIICISKSGNTDELKLFVRIIKDLGNKIISICGNNNSFLSRSSDFFIDSSVDEEFVLIIVLPQVLLQHNWY